MNCEGERDPSRTPQQERIQAVQKSLCNYKKSGPPTPDVPVGAAFSLSC